MSFPDAPLVPSLVVTQHSNHNSNIDSQYNSRDMEKPFVQTPLLPPKQPHEDLRKASWSRRYGHALKIIIVCVVASRLAKFLLSKSSHKHGHARRQDIDWSNLPTLTHLEYTDCYEEFQCARLEVPLDHFGNATDKKVSIAVVKLPAAVPVTHPNYGGAILFNPGGPGGSGVSFVLGAGLAFRTLLDARPDSNGSYFDMIGFDPRGVGLTEPAVNCHGDATAVQSFALRSIEEGLLTSSDAALGRLWSMNAAQWGSCAANDDGGIMHYMTTSSTATDMLNIVEAHGYWRESEARRLNRQTRTPMREELKHKPGKEKLQYWGFSYGTFLGATFLSMYPDRVDRVILDGVVDAEDYRQTLWYNNLVDTEKTMDLFYHHCARVGYPTCALATFNQTTKAQDVKERVAKVILSLHHDPLPVVGRNPDVISWSDIRGILFGSLYSPVQSWPLVAYVLSRLEQGDGTELAQFLQFIHVVSCPSSDEPEPVLAYVPYPGAIIKCTDAEVRDFDNKTAFEGHLNKLRALSPTGGDIWATITMPCRNFPLRPLHRYTGSWAGNTSHPVLWIGNTADPVTPLASAKRMANGFNGSVVLTQDSPGHCSLAAFSRCTSDYIYQYFQTGEPPPKDTVCGVEQIPWGPTPGDDTVVTEDVKAGIQSQDEIANALHRASGGLGRSGLVGRFAQRVIM
ncbi:hypothetical protein K461DRAFT_310843 [Myriangium duriaei CBS 260.36]|uniref:Peptidase S33 tripeptidyl aminopeptidase-like C-terminal domain-containing protein n=1 Tax=Myriangium duriaei CBS 260.36 TaxID=1168546 RepID=A0A9P4MKK8_9PEZI|nr:hypothetical protein K461DRAFT_310843 [Myriangium duriaei CBS 260.36]